MISGVERKKILWLSHLVPYPPKGGVLQRSYNLLKELARYHDVYLLALVQPDLAASQMKALDEQLLEAHDVLSTFCREVKFVHLPHLERSHWKYREALRALLLFRSYSISWLRSRAAAKEVRRWQDIKSFDVVHCDTISLMPLAINISGAKLVLNHHNIESHMMFRRAEKEGNPFAKAYYYQEAAKILFYEKRWCSKVNLNLTCSALDSQRLHDIVRDVNTMTVENGVDLAYFAKNPATMEVPNTLIFAGGLGWYPNLDAMRHFATDIWPLIVGLCPDVIMNLVGRGKDEELQKVASQYREHFLLHGFVDDVRPYLAAASVYVCPIRDGGGTKLKVLDAMAMKCAIVAYPEACEGIDVENGRQVRIVDSPEKMAEVVVELLRDAGQRKRLGEAARLLIEDKYSFASIGADMASAYSRL